MFECVVFYVVLRRNSWKVRRRRRKKRRSNAGRLNTERSDRSRFMENVHRSVFRVDVGVGYGSIHF
jgi:hypothetical protein